ncbi:flagellar basal-body MS-ring/collar protein FliF [Microbacterium stercoris]|uniref:Flagellar M-ring protein n=1 Tax=Microbacterium stercoris TaxID=2820289 RepID=A0A939TRK2_9MICO|nr:flagellar basal-body MS-ring/collar protein FliF [Microbacterium stercoris]MBO3664605.1 flagellar M-ring protein FliF [Microbacterium stercoris]
MPQAVQNVFQRLGQAISSFTIAQRTIALIGVAVLALGAVALGSWMTRPQLAPLFTGLTASDANAIVEQLRSSGVQYELADGGATVMVPQGDVYDQRLTAAAAGLPSGVSDGYTLLDDMGVTTSEFQQSVTYKRAIEGELARTISSVEGVSAASVQLAIPEESVFVSETVDPTASVFVETGGGSALAAKQVEAIVHLTSAAISGMKPENVAVIDQTGRTLSAVGVGTSGSTDQQANDYEAHVASGIQEMLDRVVGAGNATVTVAAEMSNQTSERTSETYTRPEGDEETLTSDEQTRSESYTGGAGGTGVLGPDNIAVPDGANGGNYTSTETTRNNLVDKSTEVVTTPAGAVERQTVSVAVDTAAMKGMSAQAIEDLVATAAGLDTGRGDRVTVQAMPFSTVDADAAKQALLEAKEAEEAERAQELLRTGLISAAIALPLIIGAVLLGVRRRRAAADPMPAPLELTAETMLLDALADDPITLQPSAPAIEPLPTARLELDPDDEPEEPEQVSLERQRHDLEALARRDPQKTAEVLRTLMLDRVEG